MAGTTAHPVIDQPGGKEIPLMPQPQVAGCPPGIEYLTNLDQLIVKQNVECCEVASGVACKNKYNVTNNMGQQVYFAYEESGFCRRYFCSNFRSFTMHIMDNMNKEVIRCKRPLQWCAGWTCCINGQKCCAYRIDIEAPPGNPVGYVYQGCSVCKPKYSVHDENMDEVLTIGGPCDYPCGCCCCSCTKDVHFRFASNDGNEIGAVTKIWNGCLKECYTNSNTFTVKFPMDLDVKLKATLLGRCS